MDNFKTTHRSLIGLMPDARGYAKRQRFRGVDREVALFSCNIHPRFRRTWEVKEAGKPWAKSQTKTHIWVVNGGNVAACISLQQPPTNCIAIIPAITVEVNLLENFFRLLTEKNNTTNKANGNAFRDLEVPAPGRRDMPAPKIIYSQIYSLMRTCWRKHLQTREFSKNWWQDKAG